jgi:hypothetical protein
VARREGHEIELALISFHFIALMVSDTNVVRIRELNDSLRRTLSGGEVFFTRGIDALPIYERAFILDRVCAFDDFTPDNDPHGEHDCGSFEHGGKTIFWKIDYYDLSLENGSPDPSDPALTRRVLTIMLAEEY